MEFSQFHASTVYKVKSGITVEEKGISVMLLLC